MATPVQTSVDRAELHRWRFSQANGFVIRDWTGVEKGGDPVTIVLKADDIFDYIAEATANKAKIAVYAIGPCVMDLSTSAVCGPDIASMTDKIKSTL